MSLWAAAHVFFFVAGVEPLAVLDVSIGRLVFALSCMSAVWFLLNSGLTAVAVSLESNRPVLQVWQRIAVLGVNYAAAASASLCMVILTRFAGITADLTTLYRYFDGNNGAIVVNSPRYRGRVIWTSDVLCRMGEIVSLISFRCDDGNTL